MKNHIQVDEKESQEIVEKLKQQKETRENSMVYVVNNVLKEVPYPMFNYYMSGTVASRRTVYLLWENKVYGKIFLDFRNNKDTIVFVYNNAEIRYDWVHLAKDINNARREIIAYVEGAN